MLTVYAAAWCPHCTMTVEFLKKHGIAFTYVEIEDQPQDVIDKIIQVNGGDDWVVPTLEYNGKWREGRFYNELALLSDLQALGGTHLILWFFSFLKNEMTMNQSSRNIHDTMTVIDCLEISRWGKPVFEQMRQGGLTAVNCTCSILENFRQTIQNIAWWQKAFTSFSDLIMPVHDTADIIKAKQANKTGIILGFQNTSAIEDDLCLLGVFHQLGVRVMQLTYMEGNLSGQGCLERFDAGLTHFGKEVIEEMNRLGILIDLSHVGNQTSLEAIVHSRQPVALTHANPKSLCDHPRNKPDDVIRAVADKGGVVGATIFPPFLPAGNRSVLADFIDVIDYLVDMIGVDHVAVGTDFTTDQPREWFDWILTGRSKKGPVLQLQHPLVNPKGIQSAADFPNITAALLERGYDAPQTTQIMGENMMRLFSKVWKKPASG